VTASDFLDIPGGTELTILSMTQHVMEISPPYSDIYKKART